MPVINLNRVSKDKLQMKDVSMYNPNNKPPTNNHDANPLNNIENSKSARKQFTN